MELIYSEERGTWNLFEDGEWIFEGTWEQCDRMIEIHYECMNEEDC